MRIDRICLVALPLVSLALLAGCQKKQGAQGPAGPADGTETGKCYGNGTCNAGLICSGSKICVKPPPADCAKVAQQMSYVELGNYAEPAERNKYVAAQRARCQKLAISKDEGACIARARHPAELNKCHKGLVELARCDKLVAHVLRIMKGDPTNAKVRKFLAKSNQTAKLVKQCEKKHPSKADEACVLRATSLADLKQCKL